MPTLCVSAHIYCTHSEHVSQDDGNTCPLCACQPTYIAHPQSMSAETMVLHAHSVRVSPHILHTLRACQQRRWSYMPTLCVSAHIYCAPSEHVSGDDGNTCPLCACQPTYIAHPQSETMVIHACSVCVSPHILCTLRACQPRRW